jgi:hypothetical protein
MKIMIKKEPTGEKYNPLPTKAIYFFSHPMPTIKLFY